MKRKIISWVVILFVILGQCLTSAPANASATQAKPLIFHIQTAHGNYEAQQDIRQILHQLHDRYGVKTLFVEGAASGSRLHPEFLEFFPGNKNLNLKIAEELTKKSFVKGSELFLMEAKDASAYGIENLDLCVQNGQALMTVRSQKEQISEFLSKLDASTEKLSSRFVSSDLRNFLKDGEKNPDAGSLRRLVKESKKQMGLDFDNPRIQLDWPMLFRVWTLLEWKSQSKKSIRSTIEKEISGPELFNESAKLRDLIARKMANTPKALEVLNQIKNARLLHKLFALELTPADYELLTQRMDQIKTLVPGKIFNQALQFYELARKRDGEMLSNIEKQLKGKNVPAIAVITGGFHCEPFKNYFKNKNYQYFQITPSVSVSEGKQSYFDSISVISSTWEPPFFVTALKTDLARQGVDTKKVDREVKKAIALSLGIAPLEIYMVEPFANIYGIHYEINAHMDKSNQADSNLAVKQWQSLVRVLRSMGIKVHTLPQRQGWPDMVFAANAGYADGKFFIPTHFTHAERQGETPHNIADLKELGFEIHDVIDKGLNWEGEGDMLPYGQGRLFGGYGHRSEIKAHEQVAKFLGKKLSVLELVDERFYHLDTCFFPLSDGKTVLYFPGAFTAEGRAEILRHVANPIAVSEEDAMYFVCNGLSYDKIIVVNKASDKLTALLREQGFIVVENSMSEYLKSGGSVKCTILTMESWNHGTPRTANAQSLGQSFEDLKLETAPNVAIPEAFLPDYVRSRGNVLPLGLAPEIAEKVLAQIGFPKTEISKGRPVFSEKEIVAMGNLAGVFPIQSAGQTRALFVVRDSSHFLTPETDLLFQLAESDPNLKIVIWTKGKRETKHLLPNLSVAPLPKNVNGEIDHWIANTKSSAGFVAPDDILQETAFRGGLVKAQILPSQTADEQNLTALLLAKKLQNLGSQPQDPFTIYTGQTLAGSEGFWQDLLADLDHLHAFQTAA